MKKRIGLICEMIGLLLSLAAVVFLLAGCQPTPETEAVVSKNDGALAAALQTTAEPADDEETADAAEAQTYSYTDSFQNTAGSITYTVNVQDVTVPDTAMSVLQVTPHEFTGTEVQTVAGALFGDAEVYEYSTELSKAEIENAILEKRQFISDRDALVAYYGGDEEMADATIAQYENSIAELEELYQTASDSVEPTPCQWTFYPESHYDDQASGIETEEDDGIQVIRATATADGAPYQLWATNRSSSDYRIHSISVYMQSETMTSAEMESAFYSHTRPTDEELAAVQEKAEEMLAAMDIGQWTVASCEVSSWDDDSGKSMYFIYIDAYPVYNGQTVVPLGGMGVYADSYEYEAIQFRFSGEQLVEFTYSGALEVVRTVNENVQTISFDEAMSRFRQQMELSDPSAYSIYAEENEEDAATQAVSATVTVDSVTFGLTRVRIQNNDTDFYLLPAYTFMGSANVTYADGSTAVYDDAEAPNGSMALVTINAVDGSVVDTENGY